MKHIIFKILILVTTTLLGVANICAQNSEWEWMTVGNQKIKVDDKRCYLIRKGISRKDTAKWEVFCGGFTNFYYEEGYPYKLYVEKYDPQADTINVIKSFCRDGSGFYIRRDGSDSYYMKKKRDAKAKRDNQGLADLVVTEGVSKINEKAFSYFDLYVVNLTLPQSLKEIGDDAFSLIHNLKTITSKAKIAPRLGQNAFNNIRSIKTVYIPAGSLDSYKKEWGSKFKFKEKSEFK